MREKFTRFMSGRCGIDQLNRFLSILSLVLMILAVVFNGTVLCCQEIYISAVRKITAT
mgnify:CR=1 FL=1